MTAVEHYQEAERLLTKAAEYGDDEYGTRRADVLATRALGHAMLAALAPPQRYIVGPSMTQEQRIEALAAIFPPSFATPNGPQHPTVIVDGDGDRWLRVSDGAVYRCEKYPDHERTRAGIAAEFGIQQ